MAEGRDNNNVVCRFFATTGCRDGEKCAFPHDRSHTVLDSVCRFYMIGKCIYGLRCRYSHVRPSTSASTSSSSSKTNKKDSRNVKCGTNGVTRSSESKVPKSQSSQNFRTQECSETGKSSTEPINPNWVHVPEFVPKTRKSYADTLKSDDGHHGTNKKLEKSAEDCLCPYYMVNDCPYEDRCKFVHGEICEICGKACLMPFDKEQQQKHREECEKELEKDMEISFAVQRSADKMCGICMDVVMEKEALSDRRFGILEKCNHVFCLACIRKWRQVKRTENMNAENIDPCVTRACPQCRVPSDFITPSQYWVDSEEEKKQLIASYKDAMRKKPCRYFEQGRGTCPFAGACFYLHAYPDGRIADLPPPRPRRRRNQNGDVDLMDQIYLWDFLDFRDEYIRMNSDWDDVVYDISDSDVSITSITDLLE